MILLPTVVPRRLLAFAGTALDRDGATVGEIGVAAGVRLASDRRRCADILVQAGFCALDGVPWTCPATDGDGPATTDRSRLHRTEALSSLDDAMRADDLDRVDASLSAMAFHAAAKRALSVHNGLVLHSPRGIALLDEAFGPGAPVTHGRLAFAYPVALGRAWFEAGRLMDGDARVPHGLTRSFGHVFDELGAGEVTALAMLGRLCSDLRVGPERMHRALQVAVASGRMSGWEFLTRFGSRASTCVSSIDVLSGSLRDMATRSVPLDRFLAGETPTLVVRSRRRRSPKPMGKGRVTGSTQGAMAVPQVEADVHEWRMRWRRSTPLEPVPLQDLLRVADALVPGRVAAGAEASHGPDATAEAMAVRELVDRRLVRVRGEVTEAGGLLEGMVRAIRPGGLTEATDAVRSVIPELDSVIGALGVMGKVRPMSGADMDALSDLAFGRPDLGAVALPYLRHAVLLGAAWTDGPFVRHGEGAGDPARALADAFAMTGCGGAVPTSRLMPAFCSLSGLSPARASAWLRRSSKDRTLPGLHLLLDRDARPSGGDADLHVLVSGMRVAVDGHDAVSVVSDADAGLAGMSLSVVVDACGREAPVARVDLLWHGVRLDASAEFDPDDDVEARRMVSTMRGRMAALGAPKPRHHSDARPRHKAGGPGVRAPMGDGRVSPVLPNVGPRPFLAFAGMALSRPGATVEDIGERAGLRDPGHRRRVASMLVQARLCGLHRPPVAKAGDGRRASGVHDDDRLSPTPALARLDDAMAGDDLDQANDVLLRLRHHGATEAFLAANPRLPAGSYSACGPWASGFGDGATPGEVANALAMAVALGRAWRRDVELLDGRASLPPDLGRSLEEAYASVESRGEALASAVLDRLCVDARVSPARMQRALGTLLDSGWVTTLRFESGRGRDIKPVRDSVVSGRLVAMSRRSVPLDHLRVRRREAYVLRREANAVPAFVRV